jgi:hypothetical protein
MNCAAGNVLAGGGGYRCYGYYNSNQGAWLALNVGGIPTFSQRMNFSAPVFTPVTVAGLPGSPVNGEVAFVTDATNCAAGNQVVGSGSYKCFTYYNATASQWLALNVGGIPNFAQAITFSGTDTFADGGTWGSGGIVDIEISGLASVSFSNIRLQNSVRGGGGHGMMTLDNGSGTANTGYQAGFINLSPTTLSGLSTQDPTPQDGDQAAITDCNANCTTLNGAVTGGGATHEHIHYDSSSSSWKAG